MSALLFAYQYTDLTFELPAVWISNIYYYCNVTGIDKWSFLSICILEGSLISSAYGAYLGILYQAKFMGGNYTHDGVDINGFMRLFYTFGLFIAFSLPYMEFPLIEDVRIATLFYTLLPSWGYGFVAFSIMDKFFSILNIKSVNRNNW